MQLIDEVVAELFRFSETILELHTPVEESNVLQFEAEHKLVLPQDYKTLLRTTDGFSLMGTEVYGISGHKKQSLAEVYYREHELITVPQFSHLVPFCNDGRGNFYCFDTRVVASCGQSCPIVFWVSNYEYSLDDQPEKTHDSFTAWVQECVIDWTLEDYDYNGDLIADTL